MKKLISTLLTLIMVLSLISTTVTAEDAKYAIEPQFEEAGDFHEGLAAVRKDGRYCYIDKTGKIVIELEQEYNTVGNFNEGLAPVRKGEYWGFIDNVGKLVVEPKYRSVGYFNEGLTAVLEAGQDGRWGYINSAGKKVIPSQFYSAGTFNDGLAVVMKKIGDDYKYGYIDNNGRIVISPQYETAGDFKDGLAIVRKVTEWTYKTIDFGGEAELNGVKGTLSMTTPYAKTDKWSYIDKSGTTVLSLPEINIPDGIGENTFMGIKQDGTFTYSIQSSAGGIITRLDIASPFNEGLAVSREGGSLARTVKTSLNLEVIGESSKLRYIDSAGNTIIGAQFNEASPFSEGLALVGKRDTPKSMNSYDSLEGVWGFIAKDGKFAFTDAFNEARSFKNGFAAVKKYVKTKEFNGLISLPKWGFICKSGQFIIEPQFDAVGDFNEGLASVKVGSSWGYINIPDPATIQAVIASKAAKDTTVENNPKTASVKPEKTNAVVTFSGGAKKVTFETYCINGEVYIKLRDIASALNGTRKAFAVGWDSKNNAISITSGKKYIPVGGELTVSDSSTAKEAKLTTTKTYLNGKEAKFTTYSIGGSNYFKLKDIAKALNFALWWDAMTGKLSVINTVFDYKE